MIFDIIGTLLNVIPFFDFGKIRIEFIDLNVQFFKPIAGKSHWREENYSRSPIKYKIKCKIRVYNGKKHTAGIKDCKIFLKECPILDFYKKIAIDYSVF